MWLGERITDKGLGNGTSLIIMVGFLPAFHRQLVGNFHSGSTRTGDILIFIIEIALFITSIWVVLC